jgi:hypothetical protein
VRRIAVLITVAVVVIALAIAQLVLQLRPNTAFVSL